MVAQPESERPPALILGGICLTGKTTLATQLVANTSLTAEFIEGDSLHMAEAIAKMRSGQPLDDADRAQWRERLCQCISERSARLLILSCSALTRAFRDRLRVAGDVRIVFLVMGRQSAESRAAKRLSEEPEHYYQPALHPALLDGQYRDLQIPGPDEPDCLVVDLDAYPQGQNGPEVDPLALAREVLEWLSSAPTNRSWKP